MFLHDLTKPAHSAATPPICSYLAEEAGHRVLSLSPCHSAQMQKMGVQRCGLAIDV